MRRNRGYKKHKKVWMFILLAVIMFALNYRFQWTQLLMDIETYQNLQNLVENHMGIAIVIYVIITVITCVVLVLPGVTYAVVGSLVFGPFLGTICCVIAVTMGAGIAFIVGRYFLKDDLKPTIQKNKYMNKLLFQDANRNDFVILMITRLVPVFPYNLQNFAYGITDISFRNYMIYSFLFMIPGTAMYTIGTAGVVDSEKRVLYISITVIISLVVIILGKIIKDKYVTEPVPQEGDHVNEQPNG